MSNITQFFFHLQIKKAGGMRLGLAPQYAIHMRLVIKLFIIHTMIYSHNL